MLNFQGFSACYRHEDSSREDENIVSTRRIKAGLAGPTRGGARSQACHSDVRQRSPKADVFISVARQAFLAQRSKRFIPAFRLGEPI